MKSIAEPSFENVQPMPVVAKGTERVDAAGSATYLTSPQSLLIAARRLYAVPGESPRKTIADVPSRAAETSSDATTEAKSSVCDASSQTVADSAPVPKSETDTDAESVVKPLSTNAAVAEGEPGMRVVKLAVFTTGFAPAASHVTVALT